jgi:hypothetical protein
MSQQSLREHLEQMRDELNQAVAANPTDAGLQKLQSQTSAALAQISADDQASDGELQRGLPEAIERFEASHPSLTLAMMRVADALSGLGL